MNLPPPRDIKVFGREMGMGGSRTSHGAVPGRGEWKNEVGRKIRKEEEEPSEPRPPSLAACALRAARRRLENGVV